MKCIVMHKLTFWSGEDSLSVNVRNMIEKSELVDAPQCGVQNTSLLVFGYSEDFNLSVPMRAAHSMSCA